MPKTPCAWYLTCTLLFSLMIPILASLPAAAETVDLGDGFNDHGPLSRIAGSRGWVCTQDAEGTPLVLVWLFDHRYSYALGVINAETGQMEEIPRPPIGKDCPFSSLLSDSGRYYTYFGGHFLEFDPKRREFTGVEPGPGRAAMSMTEDDEGVIWAAVYPDCDVVGYNPETGEAHNYGSLYEYPSTLYPRSIAADDRGWIYVHIGLAANQIIILNPQTGATHPVVPKNERVESQSGRGHDGVVRDINGKVYGYTLLADGDRQWYELYNGQARKLDGATEIDPKQIITGAQGLSHEEFPNGERVQKLDLKEGQLIVEDPATGDTRELEFETSGEGGHGMCVVALPDGTLAGGTYHPNPKQFFNYDPQTDTWVRRDCYGQWNAMAVTEDLVYIGTYSAGVLLEWDPAEQWVKTAPDNPDSNPRPVAQAQRDIQRPYEVMVYPDDPYVIMAGMPDYGRTGGGLLFYNRQAQTANLLTHEDLVR